jgi:hypothetical protein
MFNTVSLGPEAADDAILGLIVADGSQRAILSKMDSGDLAVCLAGVKLL